jgi:hypothetical protein
MRESIRARRSDPQPVSMTMHLSTATMTLRDTHAATASYTKHKRRGRRHAMATRRTHARSHIRTTGRGTARSDQPRRPSTSVRSAARRETTEAATRRSTTRPELTNGAHGRQPQARTISKGRAERCVLSCVACAVSRVRMSRCAWTDPVRAWRYEQGVRVRTSKVCEFIGEGEQRSGAAHRNEDAHRQAARGRAPMNIGKTRNNSSKHSHTQEERATAQRVGPARSRTHKRQAWA